MIKQIRKIVNFNSYHYASDRLLAYRKRALCSKGLIRFIYLHSYYRLCRFFSADIPLETKIGDGLVLPHGANGIFISRGAKIGKNCVIFHQVTIGSNTIEGSKHFGSPQIGDNAYIGCGAKIIGNVIIGNNVRIGANAVVTESIPDNATVVMNHPRIIIAKTKRQNRFKSL